MLPFGGAAAAHPLTYWLSALECTIDISKARRELGYEPVRSRAEGMDAAPREPRGRRLTALLWSNAP